MAGVRLLCLDVNKGEFREVTCSGLNDYYRELNCETFDIVRRNIAGKEFDIFCDDDGMFAEKPIPSALDGLFNVALVGNLIFANHSPAGDTTELSEQDIAHIKKHSVHTVNIDTGKQWLVVFPCDYV